MYEYKVVSQKDKWFSGKFNPETLEKVINSLAEQGWKLITCTSADFPAAFGNSRQEIVLIFERKCN